MAMLQAHWKDHMNFVNSLDYCRILSEQVSLEVVNDFHSRL